MIKKNKLGSIDFRVAGKKTDDRYKLIFGDTDGNWYHVCMYNKNQQEEVEKDFYYNYLNYGIDETIEIMKNKYNRKKIKE